MPNEMTRPLQTLCAVTSRAAVTDNSNAVTAKPVTNHAAEQNDKELDEKFHHPPIVKAQRRGEAPFAEAHGSAFA
jgi:hypothetical protein